MCELIGICRPLYPILRNYTYLVAHKTTTKRKHFIIYIRNSRKIKDITKNCVDCNNLHLDI